MRSASPWLPAAYCAVASRHHRRSRSGAARTIACAVGEHLARPAEPQQGVDAQLLRLEPQLVEPGGLVARRLPVAELGERRPAPQRQGAVEEERDAVGLAHGEELARPDDLGLEVVCVHLVRGSAST